MTDTKTAPLRRMHLNESPFPVPQYIVDAITKAATRINQYPDTLLPPVFKALAEYTGIDETRLFLSCGSNEILHLLPLISGATQPGDELIIPTPSFPTYTKVAGHFDLTVREIPVCDTGKPDVPAILAAIGPRTKLICVPTPNNPTGEPLTAAELEQLVCGVPETIMLHIDEAYYEFGIEAGGADTLPIISKRQRNWISTRSFSKAFGLAGLRLGYGIAADPALAARASARLANFSTNAMALVAGHAALSNLNQVRRDIAAVAVERNKIAAGLTALGLTPLPSAANFVSFFTPDTKTDIIAALKQSGILVKAFSMPRGRQAIRISVGCAEDTNAVLQALAPLALET